MSIKIKKLYETFGIYYLKVWAWHALAIACVLSLDPTLLINSLVIFFVFFPLVQVISHDYIGHEYVRPKNNFCKFLVLNIWYMMGQTIQDKKNYHVTHHVNWKNPEVDPTQRLLQGKPLWRYLFSLHLPVPQMNHEITTGILVNDSLIKLLDRYSDHIYWIVLVAMFIALPWQWFVMLRVYPAWFLILASKFHDWYFHGNGPKKDTAWLLPLYGSASWHIRHHQNWREEYHGPGVWKWANLCWYFQRLMFVKTTHDN